MSDSRGGAPGNAPDSMMKILVVDDDEVTRQLLTEVLVKEGYQVVTAPSGEAAVKAIKKDVYPIVLSDIRMLELDGMAVLREVKRTGKKSSVILMTGFGSMEGALEAIREGAFDYVSKPFKMDDLKAVVSRAAELWDAMHSRKSERGSTLQKIDGASKALIGKSPRIVEVYKMLARAALSQSNVLVVGENGTGKELVAHAIHDNSPRRKRKFVTLADPETLDDRFSEASGGTLYIDNLPSLSTQDQIRLTRLLEEQSEADVRCISATPLDLETSVRQGRFREDLFYKLKVLSIDLPPLRDRLDDLPDLIEYFLARFSEKDRKKISHVSEEAMVALRAYAWPGNVRELEHAIEHAVAMARTAVLFPEDFPAEILKGGGASPGAAPAGAPGSVAEGAHGSMTSLEEMERAHILRVLQEVNYNKSKASEILGIDRATLYRKAQRYGLDLRGK